jgi:BolA protein
MTKLSLGMRRAAVENPAMSMRAERIRTVLLAAFTQAEVLVQDDSHHHAGHAGAAPGGQTHFTVQVISPAFAGQSRVARYRAVHGALGAEFGSGLHALSLRLLTPEEAVAAA